MYHIASSFDIPATRRREFIAAALEDGRNSLADEPGTRRFELIEDSELPNRFYLNETYDDEDAFDAHAKGPHFAKFFSLVEDFAQGPNRLIKGNSINSAGETKHISSTPDAIAPDGSEVRVLCTLPRGGLAVFTLPPKSVSKAVAHHTVEEVWYFISGYGRMWRQLNDHEEIVNVGPGVSITIPTGTHFQFRCDGLEPITAVGATMPPWPGEHEAHPVKGKWASTV